MNRFENKVVVITGAASGIGEATTRRIVSEGGKVVIADHSEKRAEQLANELTHAGADVRHVYFSATELQSCKELIDFSMNEYQRIDVLINNVGGTDPKRDLSIEKLDINYFPSESLLHDVSFPTGHSYHDCQWWRKHCQRSFHKRTYG